jgi:hypothetical protein
VLGVVGCLLLGTWEVAHLAVDEWFRDWAHVDLFVRKRIIYYGIAFSMAIGALAVTSTYAFEFGRFGRTINRAVLWYGTLLLLTTIGIFVLDCLPEVVAGFLGAGIFSAAIYFVQKRYFTEERTMRARLEKGRCFACSGSLPAGALFCPLCAVEVGTRCTTCQALVRIIDKYCPQCRSAVSRAA